MDRIEAKSCYLLLGYKDNRVEIFEEKGRGTGKIESCGSISNWNNSETPREVLGENYSLSLIIFHFCRITNPHSVDHPLRQTLHPQSRFFLNSNSHSSD